jgi:hypothetical protein
MLESNELLLDELNDGAYAVIAIDARRKRDLFIEGLKQKWQDSELTQTEIEEYAKAYYVYPIPSSPRYPLDIDDWGIASVMTRNVLDTSAVRITAIYEDEAAEAVIAQHHGRKKEATEGTSFVVVEYATTESAQDAYLDVRFLNVDGLPLVYNGVNYSQRTYDLLDDEQIDQESSNIPLYVNRYVYFEVPKGCTKYLLSFGWRIPNEQYSLASAEWVIIE